MMFEKGTKPVLEKLVIEGWEDIGSFGDARMFKKDKERLLYDVKTDVIQIKYNDGVEARLK